MTDNIEKVSVQRVDLAGLLREKGERFEIPHYQRKYAWTKENCEAFLDDVLAVAADERPTHFFSNVTLCPLDENGSYYVVDGQQRVTTLGLFIGALSKALPEFSEELKLYIKDGNILKLSFEDQMDQRTYRHLLLDHFCEPESLSATMVENFNFLENEVKASESNLRTALNDGLLTKLLFVRVILPQKMPPQRVFERMNGTKLTTTPFDLIKNFLLMEAKGNEDVVYNIAESNLWKWYEHIWILVSMHALEAVPQADIYKHFKPFYAATPAKEAGAEKFLTDLESWVDEFEDVKKVFASLNCDRDMKAGDVWRFGPLLMKLAMLFPSREDRAHRNQLIARMVKSRRSWVATERLHINKLHRYKADATISNNCLKEKNNMNKSSLFDEQRSLSEIIIRQFEVRSSEWVEKAFAYWVKENAPKNPTLRYVKNMEVLGLQDISQKLDVTTAPLVESFHLRFEERARKLDIDCSEM